MSCEPQIVAPRPVWGWVEANGQSQTVRVTFQYPDGGVHKRINTVLSGVEYSCERKPPVNCICTMLRTLRLRHGCVISRTEHWARYKCMSTLTSLHAFYIRSANLERSFSGTFLQETPAARWPWHLVLLPCPVERFHDQYQGHSLAFR